MDSLNLGENVLPNFFVLSFSLDFKCHLISLQSIQDLFVYFTTTQFTALRKTENV